MVYLTGTMLSINPLENLKIYVTNRPPLVIFMVSVSAVAIAFLTIGYFFKIKEIKSPEMTEDWNMFLLSGLMAESTPGPASLLGHQVGLTGREAHEEMNISFTLPSAWNSDECVLHGHCEQVVFSTCMTVTAASSVFPVTVQPPHCIPETYTNATTWYKIFTTARDANTKYTQDYNPFWCYKGAIGKVYHALNPKLTVIVPNDDRSLINLHLMHTSYFLFVMVITMFCYAVIKGRPGKVRQSSANFCPEKVALSEA
ncbi:transmembrane protein 248 isoform X2 [Huso huso]|uniref:Transmembrane protein 248 n=1 Tax=Huso huso TaxID=61971 RepID=A0ABR0YRX4_HUSHU